MGLTVEQCDDLIKATLADLGEAKFTPLMSDLQDHVIMGSLMKQNRTDVQGGKSISFNTVMGTSGAAKNTTMWSTDVLSRDDLIVQGNVPWRMTTTNYLLNTVEMQINKGKRQIVDIVKLARADAMVSLAELMEKNGWTAPAATDDRAAYGIPYWVVKNSSEGFNGGDPSGHTKCGDIDSDVYARWKNYTAQYAAITKEDLIRKMRKAMYKTDFKMPVSVPDYSTGSKRGLYTTYNVVSAMEEILESQNDNLGNDVAAKDGLVVFRRTPVSPVPYLDVNDTTDPIYGINWGDFKITFLSGMYMRETGPRDHPSNHNVRAVHVDLMYNFVCRNRRSQFVMYK